MKYVCERDKCSGCMACSSVCPKDAITIQDSITAINAVISEEKCIKCGLCEKHCPNITLVRLTEPKYWKQGWAEDSIRASSSSGGVAAAIIQTFIKSGGYVASCMFFDGDFRFVITNDIEISKKFAGSKYVKSNPDSIYKVITRLLQEGEKVLFIGLPCQSAAVLNVCGTHDNLTVIDLICHGTPSIKILKKYLEECGKNWERIQDIKFRESEFFGLSVDDNRIVPRRAKDSYTCAFLKSLDYTENCYSCRYATFNRVSDITLGDAWGGLSDAIRGGVSLILCQTKKGIILVENAGIHLEEIDIHKAVSANHQLNHPSIKHPKRQDFLMDIIAGKTVSRSLFSIDPKECIKQRIKTELIRLHVLKDYYPVIDNKTK